MKRNDNCLMVSLKEVRDILRKEVGEPFKVYIEGATNVYLDFQGTSVSLWEYLNVLENVFDTKIKDYTLYNPYQSNDRDCDGVSVIFIHSEN